MLPLLYLLAQDLHGQLFQTGILPFPLHGQQLAQRVVERSVAHVFVRVSMLKGLQYDEL